MFTVLQQNPFAYSVLHANPTAVRAIAAPICWPHTPPRHPLLYNKRSNLSVVRAAQGTGGARLRLPAARARRDCGRHRCGAGSAAALGGQRDRSAVARVAGRRRRQQRRRAGRRAAGDAGGHARQAPGPQVNKALCLVYLLVPCHFRHASLCCIAARLHPLLLATE